MTKEKTPSESKKEGKVPASTRAIIVGSGLITAGSMFMGGAFIDDIQDKSNEVAVLEQSGLPSAERRIGYLEEIKSIETGLAVLFPLLGVTTLTAAGLIYRFEKDEIASRNLGHPKYKTKKVESK